jgi:carbonic anhydrase/SulP family sulfate permease
MPLSKYLTWENLQKDITASIVVFLVALPLCLGIAQASQPELLKGMESVPQVPLFSGMIAGIVGGLVVGSISRSQTSVSGPAAGLTTVVAAQILMLGSFEAFMVALLLAGIIQIFMGFYKLGFIADFVPSSVIKGLLAAIGVILILKQIPHVVGHDKDPEGEMSFKQLDHENTFSELFLLNDFHLGAAVVGVLSLALLICWDKNKFLKKSFLPPSIVVVILGVLVQSISLSVGKDFAINNEHLVQLPVTNSLWEFFKLFKLPNFIHLLNPDVYVSAIIISLVATLETLLNLEAVDKIDPLQRTSPPNRELIAQGVGNILCGLIGGLPVTSVIVRSSVNINSGARTKLSAVIHGVLLLLSVMLFPVFLNKIPISCLAAILLLTGYKLASPMLFINTWKQGWYQFLPFIITLLAIVLTDLLEGVLIGIGVSICFILYSNLHKPLKHVYEKHISGDLIRIELANIVSFLNKASLSRLLSEIPSGGHVLFDARQTDYIDPDVLGIIQEFKETTAPVRKIKVSLQGFKEHYEMADDVLDIDFSSREVQDKLTPADVMEILKEGHRRFMKGHRLARDLGSEVTATAAGQFPIAVVLSCIDSRTPAEIIFDLGVGDIFSVRIAGHVPRDKVLGSIEYGTAVAGAKLVLVMGHTRCGAVTSAVDLYFAKKTAFEATGCEHIDLLINEIQKSIPENAVNPGQENRLKYADEVAEKNVLHSVEYLRQHSKTLRSLEESGKIAIVGGIYDVVSGEMKFLTNILKS